MIVVSSPEVGAGEVHGDPRGGRSVRADRSQQPALVLRGEHSVCLDRVRDLGNSLHRPPLRAHRTGTPLVEKPSCPGRASRSVSPERKRATFVDKHTESLLIKHEPSR
jgi:hypothetical protein